MRSFWKRLSDTGISRRMDGQLAKRVRITNQVASSLSVIAFFYCFVFYFAGLKKEGIAVILVVASFWGALGLNALRWYIFARLWFIFAINSAVIIFSYLFGKDTGIQFVLFACGSVPWLFFELREKGNIAIGVLIPLIAFLIYNMSGGAPMIDISPSVQHFIFSSIVVAIFLIFVLYMLFFAMQNERAERGLLTVNTALQSSKEELEAQQEELRQINEELSHQTEELRTSEEELRNQEEELKQTNTDLLEKNDIIEMARKTLADKAAELEISGRYKSEFLANMSHELRTPLNSVLILANLLKQNKTANLNDKQIEYATIIHRSGSDLLKLINDILDLSKIEAGKIEFVFEEVAVEDLARDMEQLFSVLATDKKIGFSVVIDELTPASIVTDRQRIEQVVKNLMSNAFKFTPEHGTVTLRFGVSQQSLLISVTDTGIGIPTDKQEHIFEAFRQADGSTSRKFGGTGLGLSISRELMKRLSGDIRVNSKAEEGSVFTLTLPLNGSTPTTINATPLSDVMYDLDNITEQTAVVDDRSELVPGQQSILIIEDDLVFASYARDFAHEKGYKTIIAISGDEGLFYAQKYKPAAIILDLGLPVIDGRNILRILKSDPELMHIPVHVMSAGEKTGISAADVENYFRKPLHENDMERAFADIGQYIAEKYRSILIYSAGNESMRGLLEKLIGERKAEDIAYDMVSNMNEARRELQNRKVECIIADIGADVEAGIETLKQLKEIAGADTYFITCLDGNISGNDERALKAWSDSIIRRSVHYTGRLLDEIALFLHKINKPQKVLMGVAVDKEFDKSLKGRKVLLADDDMRNIFSITAMLEEHDMEVIAAEHGREALEMLEQHKDIEIVLMDIMMPEMDGYEAMRHIRASGKHRKLPIIALTAKAMTGDREKCIDAGASDYITKPVDGNKLFSLMRVWLSQ